MNPFLLLNPGTPEEQRLELKPGTTSIGRSMDNDIVIAHPTLSRKHAIIDVGMTRVTIMDLKSRNGTYVNGKKVDRSSLQDKDTVRCGDAAMRFLAGTDSISDSTPAVFARSMKDLLLEEGGSASGTALRLKARDIETRGIDQLRVLLKVSEMLSSPEQIDAVLDNTLTLLFTIMEVDRGVIFLVDHETRSFVPAAIKMAPGLQRAQVFASQHILTHVLNTGAGIMSSDAVADPRFAGANSIADQSIRASMCVPLRARDAVIGVLYVDNLTRSGVFADGDLEFLTGFASQAAIAIENSRLIRKIEEESVARNKLIRFFPRPVVAKLMQSKDVSFATVDADVTILFCDICGFTQMSSTLQPRQVMGILNEYFPVMAEIVFRHGGTLEKYIGDALMAIWGAPLPDPEGADRALRCAVEMQRQLGELNAKWSTAGGEELYIHIGLNSGPVAVGNIGSSEYIQYAAIGDATNVASRVCSVAQKQEILLSSSTYDRLIDRNVPLVPLAPVVVKGKDDALQLYRLDWTGISASALDEQSSATAPHARLGD